MRPILSIGTTLTTRLGGENIREIIRNRLNNELDSRGIKLRNDEFAAAVLQTVVVFIVLVIAVMVLVIVLANLWPTFTSALTNYSNNETTFGPTVKSLTPLLIGVAVLLVVLALIFGMQVFREGGLSARTLMPEKETGHFPFIFMTVFDDIAQAFANMFSTDIVSAGAILSFLTIITLIVGFRLLFGEDFFKNIWGPGVIGGITFVFMIVFGWLPTWVGLLFVAVVLMILYLKEYSGSGGI